ncbi:hypothetical protein C8F04DRAFT_1011464 [Mycena alexandri]|uniref:F-box domain-containing protein n=1 Tax=Mycena alexandri TaxID=1745969 RepID=A0AAD6SB68_9AGAR|nr:hypothetical protein C8F04DRAFT_1011464 [Mycena alexandri]
MMTAQAGAESARPPALDERNALAADRARIADVKAKILELERSLSFLNEEKNLLQDRLDAYTYPVLILPSEIVSQIFVHFLPAYPETPPMIGPSSPNVLGQLCRKWRDIALGTPVLWRVITLSLRNGMRIHQKLRLLESWLQRSRSCLLSINIDIGGDSGNVDQELLAHFILAIAVHSGRWEHLRLHSTSLAPPFPPTTAPLPFLRTLSMSARLPAAEDSRKTSLITALPTAPLLRNLAIAFWGEHSISFYPWSQLTAFSGHSIMPHQCVDVLGQALSLVHCELFINWEAAGVPQTSRPAITLPHLETLILTGRLHSDISWNFLAIFTLPALQKFQVAEHLLQRDPVNSLKSLISRSKCSVQELELYITDSIISPNLYQLALPITGSLVFGETLDVVNPWFVPEEVIPWNSNSHPELSMGAGEDDSEGSSDESS